ncbi:hypothetical protein [Streptomyces sp. PT12]|uniref:hypothetical protein n=1 Tax=Streptomyces sp. PT12 TaxID=1510197 RepID=UPI000DE48F45|nr:hypothetical protein [Streptomyces sp. PT12]RBM05654.1 hypothetical protein DEH69_28160 [Streptomyces sp. PT12]
MTGDLWPGPGLPGLRVRAPANPNNPYNPRPLETPQGAYWCRCGAHRATTGHHAVAELIAEWQAHQPRCPARAPRPCQHCGQPTTERVPGDWPAHNACHHAWAARPVEQRRRQQAADRIQARQAQRRKAANLRAQLRRDGTPEHVINAIVSGGITAPE